MEQSNTNDINAIESSESQNLERLIVLDESAIFYSTPDDRDLNRRTAKKGDEFYITQIEKINGEFWIKVAIDKTFQGYTREGSKTAVVLPVKLNQKEVFVYQLPTHKSTQVSVLKKKEKFFLIHKTFGIENKNKLWDKVKLQNGDMGYIFSDTKAVVINKPENDRKKMCLFIVLTLYFLGLMRVVIIGLSDGGSIDSEILMIFFTYALLGLLPVALWYYVFVFVSGLFKSKKEKYYYPSLISIYSNQII
jgi:hypothetical protein